VDKESKTNSLLEELQALKQRPSSGRKTVVKTETSTKTIKPLIPGPKWANAASPRAEAPKLVNQKSDPIKIGQGRRPS